MKSLSFLIAFVIGGVCWGQEDFVGAGGDGSSTTGSFSYSMGQVAYDHDASGLNGSINEGVQQPDLTVSTVSVNPEMTSVSSVVLYPNPTAGILHLKLETQDLSDSFYEVFDITGKCLSTQLIITDFSTISFETFPASTYIVKIYNQKKEVKSFKIIKNS